MRPLSILFTDEGKIFQDSQPGIEIPAFFTDLNLDQVVQSIVSGKEQYNLLPIFYHTPVDLETIYYRQQVFRDLESESLTEHIRLFATKMQHIREQFAGLEKIRFIYQKQGYFLDIVGDYCEALAAFSADVKADSPESAALCRFGEYLGEHLKSDGFVSLADELREIKSGLSEIQYSILIDGLRVQVTHYNGEPDYSAEVEMTFAKFKHGEPKNFLSRLPNNAILNSVEEQVLTGVAQLFPGCFSRLDSFFRIHQDFLDDQIVDFDREIQFYLSVSDHLKKFADSGLKFCLPEVASSKENLYCTECFDLALANILIPDGKKIVTNDFYLKGNERILVVTGPNQGGKTTFARLFGQIHYLAGIGCPVPGSKARLFHCDNLFTHFEREENIKTLRGKLLDELVRIHKIMQEATPESMVIINEIFTSTALQDQIRLSAKILEKIYDLDLFCVWVTFIDELSTYGDKTVSLTSTVVPETPSERTFKIIRQPADGLAYALSVAEKYQLTNSLLRARLNHERISVKP